MAEVPVVEFFVTQPEFLGEPNPQNLTEVERLLKEFENHEAQEGEFLQQYKDICGRVENPIIKFLLQLIIADEEKHHAITHAMASTLKGDLNWTRPKDALRGLYSLGAEKDALLKVTEEFIGAEKKGIQECKKLTKESRKYYHGLFELLLACAVEDSQKHVAILEFLRKRLKEA